MGKYEINKPPLLSVSVETGVFLWLVPCMTSGGAEERSSWGGAEPSQGKAGQAKPSAFYSFAMQIRQRPKDTTLLDWRGATLVWLPLPSRVAFSSLGKRPKAWENHCVIATPFPLPLLPTLCVAQLIREWTIIARVHCGWALCEGCAAKLTYWQKTKDQKEETRLQTANWNANQVSRETAKRLKAKS